MGSFAPSSRCTSGRNYIWSVWELGYRPQRDVQVQVSVQVPDHAKCEAMPPKAGQTVYVLTSIRNAEGLSMKPSSTL